MAADAREEPGFQGGAQPVPGVHTVLECQVSKVSNSDTCPRPATQGDKMLTRDPMAGERRLPAHIYMLREYQVPSEGGAALPT